MSGGSYDYLFVKEPCDLPENSETLRRMHARLLELGALDAAADTAKILQVIEEFLDTVIPLRSKLEKVWKAVEWFDSFDWAKDQVDEALIAYRKKLISGETK